MQMHFLYIIQRRATLNLDLQKIHLKVLRNIQFILKYQLIQSYENLK